MEKANEWQDEYNKFMITEDEWTQPVLEDPATEKQINLLHKLGLSHEEIPYGKKECRELISDLIGQDKRARDYHIDADMLGLSESDCH